MQKKSYIQSLIETTRFFLTHFGGSYAGYAIHGFLNAPNIGNETVIELTQQARNLSQLQNLFPELDECIVFSDDGAGNPIAIDSGGGNLDI